MYCANGLHTKISSVRFACAHSKILASHGPSHGVISASNSSASQDQSTVSSLLSLCLQCRATTVLVWTMQVPAC